MQPQDWFNLSVHAAEKSFTCHNVRGSGSTLVRQNTVEVLYIYEEAMKKPIISTKCVKLLEFRTSRISSADFSAAIQWTLVRWLLSLPDLFRRLQRESQEVLSSILNRTFLCIRCMQTKHSEASKTVIFPVSKVNTEIHTQDEGQTQAPCRVVSTPPPITSVHTQWILLQEVAILISIVYLQQQILPSLEYRWCHSKEIQELPARYHSKWTAQ